MQSPCKPGPKQSAISSFTSQADKCAKAAGKSKKTSISPYKSGSQSPSKKNTSAPSPSLALNVRQATSPAYQDQSLKQTMTFAAKDGTDHSNHLNSSTMLKQRELIPQEASRPELFDFSNVNHSPDSVNRKLDVYQRSKSRERSRSGARLGTQSNTTQSRKKDVSPAQF